MSDLRRLDAIAAWTKEKAARDKERAKEGLEEKIPTEDLPDYHAWMKDAMLKYAETKAPAMVVTVSC